MFHPEKLFRPIRDALRRRIEIRDVRRELHSHIEMRIQDNIDDGMSQDDARREAYQRFGNFLSVQKTCIEIKRPGTEAIMGAFINDLRYGARMLVKRPGFTAVAVMTLALGIGVNSSIFSIVNAVLLRPLSYKEPNRLVQFWETNPIKGWNGDTNPCAPANFLDWQRQSQSFDGMAASVSGTSRKVSLSDFYLTGGDQPERILGVNVTSNLFDVLGVSAELGRTFTEEENWQGKNRVVVMSHGLWQRRFGSDPSIVGKTITLNGVNITVVGVMPPWFSFPSKEADLWSPMGWNPNQIAEVRRPHYLRVIARLKPNVTLAQARSEMTGIAEKLEQQYPVTNKKMGLGLAIMKDWAVADASLALYVFLGAVGFVLLIACANVANLLLARAATRTKEFAIRASLGAGRERLIRQLLTESLLLSILGGAGGLALAALCNKLVIMFSPGGIPRLDEIGLDFRVVAFTAGITFLTAIVFGSVPAITSSRTDLNEALKDSGQKGGSSGKGALMRNILVVTEIALSLVLVIGAGLLIKSFIRLQQVNPGFDPSNLLTLTTSLQGNNYSKNSQVLAFYQQTMDRIRTLPGVQSATAVIAVPPKGPAWTSDFTIEGRAPDDYGKEVRHNVILPNYFETMKIPMVSGRVFTDADTSQSQQVVIISEALARRHFGNQDPIGQHMKFSKPEVESPWLTIIGVVKDVKQEGLGAEARPQVYEAFAQDPNQYMNLVIRTSGDPHYLISAVRGEIKAVDKDLPPYDFKTMDEVMSTSVDSQRFTMLLLTIFAGVALLLASVGIYGVMSYTISQRTGEIGIRMALGAQRINVLTMIVRQVLVLVGIGLAVGVGGAMLLTRAMTTLLYDVGATDPLVFILISALLTGVAMLACFIPARRATRIDPLAALRYE